MPSLKHLVLSNPGLVGFEYGMLRDFEEEIVRITGAEQVDAPTRKLPKFVSRRIGHGTRYGGLRRLVPREAYQLSADVLWVILMGPEAFSLDLFKGWDNRVGLKILYLFDTMEKQLPSLQRVLDACKWDCVVTSFVGAKPFLEEKTQRPWNAVPQGVKLERFYPAPAEEKSISFSAYGRRVSNVHESVRDYCQQSGKHYEYTTAASLQPQLDPRENYGIYAWHLNHSVFNFCWPVELTNPERVQTFSPITCRWFEAAASGNVILGQAPSDPAFAEIFGRDAVVAIPHDADSRTLKSIWAELWENRHRHSQAALERRTRLAEQWSWQSRVDELLKIAGVDEGNRGICAA